VIIDRNQGVADFPGAHTEAPPYGQRPSNDCRYTAFTAAAGLNPSYSVRLIEKKLQSAVDGSLQTKPARVFLARAG